jgi:hypothetical protein
MQCEGVGLAVLLSSHLSLVKTGLLWPVYTHNKVTHTHTHIYIQVIVLKPLHEANCTSINKDMRCV